MAMTYDVLLQRARSRLPEKVTSGERFQVPEPDIFVEGKTTVLRNFGDLCDVIRRDPQTLLAYLLRELGTAGVLEGRRVVFKGKVTAPQVADRLKDYIAMFVLCSECGRPDTHLVREERVTILECEACGARRPVRAVKKAVKEEEDAVVEGKTYEMMIEEISRRGDGIARKDRYIIYVPGTKKGVAVKVFIEKVAGTVAFGRLVRE